MQNTLSLQKKRIAFSEMIMTQAFIAWSLSISAILFAYFLLTHGHPITGPYIFGDELTYFSFARSIYQGKSLSPFTQYGPLYPLLISNLLYFGTVAKTYKMIRILNIVFFVSTIIPAYFLAKELFSHFWLRILLPLTVLLTPFSGFVYLVWAEPLYISLFYWSCLFLCLHVKKSTLINSLLLGITLASLYFTKPAAGLAVQIAGLLTLSYHCITSLNEKNWKNSILAIIAIITCFALDFPWMLHYHHMGLSIVGYPTATADLNWRIIHEGYLSIATGILLSFFYQFSYVFVGSWGIIGICTALLIVEWKSLNNITRDIILFAILCAFGLMALSALGMSSYKILNYKMPNGRYFSVILPLIISIGMYLIFKTSLNKIVHNKLLISSIVLTTLIAYIATPLYSRSPLAFTSMPEISPIIYLTDHGLVNWRPQMEMPSLLLRLLVPAILGAFVLAIYLLRNRSHTAKIAILIVLVGAAFSTFAEQHYMYMIATSQSPYNKVFIYFERNHIDISTVVFDKKQEQSNAPFLTPFWTNTQPNFADAAEILKNGNHVSAKYFVSTDKFPLTIQYDSDPYRIYQIGKM